MKTIREKLGLLKLRFKELPFRPCPEINRPAINPVQNFKIPNICYQTWETNTFGKNHVNELRYLRELNPEIEFIFFDKDEREAYMEENWGSHDIYKVYINSKFGVMQSDIFRHCILFDRGGFYIDANKKLNNPLISLINKDTSALLFFEGGETAETTRFLPPSNIISSLKFPDRYLWTSFMGYEKNHPILKNLISNICEFYPYFKNKVLETPRETIISYTGPWALTKAAWEYMSSLENFENFEQLVIDASDTNSWYMKGSEARFLQEPHYLYSKNEVIVT